MKPFYDDQGFADEDDDELRQMIELGHVPSGCLKMGQLVRRNLEDGKDPCAACPVERTKCGGRQGQVQTGPATPTNVILINDAAMAAKLYRQEAIEYMLKAMEGA